MARTQTTGSAAEFLPQTLSLPALREAAAGCKGCHLWELGTQAVFGEGAVSAEIMFVGEQPGDQEDLAGRPFVGPAGRLLDRALAEAGIDRSLTYMTNAVKHFKWQARGKRRIHKKPSWAEITACRPWLEAELVLVEPRVLVLLGATAAQSLLGRRFRVTRNGGSSWSRTSPKR
jgi:uracil-DNA glycosylase family protein